MAVANVDVTEIATQVIEAAGAIASAYTSYKIIDLAEDYYQLYAAQRYFYYNTFQQGVELPLTEYIASYNLPLPDFTARIARVVNGSYDFGTYPLAFADAWYGRRASMYGMDKSTYVEPFIDESLELIKVDWVNYSFRRERMWSDEQQDRWWSRRLAVHNIGIKQGNSVAPFLGASLEGYQDHIRDAGNMLASYGNGFARYVGYQRGLADVRDNFEQATRFRPAVGVPDYNYTQDGMDA